MNQYGTVRRDDHDSPTEQNASSDREEHSDEENATQPLLSSRPSLDWKPPRGFIWIEMGTSTRTIDSSRS